MPQLRRRPVVGALAVGAVALVAGCGGGSSSEESARLDGPETGTAGQSATVDAPIEFAEPRPLTPAEVRQALERSPQAAPPAAITGQGSQLFIQGPTPAETVLYGVTMVLVDENQAPLLAATNGISESTRAPQLSQAAQGCTLSGLAAPNVFVMTSQVSGDCSATSEGWSRGRGIYFAIAVAARLPTGAEEPADVPPSTMGPADETQRFATDALAAAGALQSIGGELQATSSVEDLNDRLPALESGLDDFDAAIAKLDGYSLDDADLEQRREGLARTGPAVSDVLRRFIAAASQNDAGEVQRLLPEVQSAINDFQQAAQGTP